MLGIFLRAKGFLKENDNKQFYDISIYFSLNQTLFIPYIFFHLIGLNLIL